MAICPINFSRMDKSQIVTPLVVSLLINIFMYLVLRPDSSSVLSPLMGSLWGILEFAIIGLYAVSPLIYGWFTKRPWESALFGIILVLFFYIPGLLGALPFLGTEGIAKSIAFGGASALFMGGAGYMAAHGGVGYFIVAVLSVLLWVFTLLSGLN